MAKGRKYAEELVGSLDRNNYNTQRDVAKQTYNTNWENIQNQYKNLTDKLKRQQEKANTDYAEGLATVADNSFDRVRGTMGNLSNKGLYASGLNNLVQQNDTQQKGEEIAKLLGSANDITVNVANQLAQGNTQVAAKEADLADKIADTLGNISAAETSAQANYNDALASIGEAMEAREFNNELQAKQRAASGGSGSGSSDIDDETNEWYRRAAILETLTDDTLDNTQKSAVLKIMTGVDNADSVVSAYNRNSTKTSDYEKGVSKLEKAYKKASSKAKASANDAKRNTINSRYNTLGGNNSSYNSVNNYIGSTDTSDVLKAAKALSNYKNTGITYEELADLLYK